jgi:O-antigen ligase
VLALITALIVARPLVLGEDPGLTSPLSNAAGLYLSVLWFVAAVGWAAWRAWAGQQTKLVGIVEAGLLTVVGLVFVSAAAAARYKHPAWLIAWEWVVLFLVFLLVRQLASTAPERRSLLAALAASAVSLSAYALFQYTVEMPRDRAQFQDPEKLRAEMARLNMEATGPFLETFQKRIQEKNVFATYAHPNAFAGLLALLIPAGLGWTIACRRQRGWSIRTLLMCFCTALSVLALWLTHSRGAILALLLVALGLFLVHGWKPLWRHRVWVLVTLAGFATVAIFMARTEWAAGLYKAQQSFAKRTEYWTATWTMILRHPWFGVGPGNFGRHYPMYMKPSAFEKVQDPHNFVFELWATCGFFAMVALLLTLAAFFRRTWSAVRSPASPATNYGLQTTEYGLRPRWEFYFGGMLGLILGFVLRAADQSGDEVLLEGVVSGVRSLIWFAAFALFDNTPWAGTSKAIALIAGVGALLLDLLVSGGIAQPSVAQPLWILAALAMSEADPLQRGLSRNWLPTVFPLPLLTAFGLAYFVLIFYPVTRSTGLIAQARHYEGGDDHSPGWHNQIEPRWRAQILRSVGNMIAACSQGSLNTLAIVHLDLERWQLAVSRRRTNDYLKEHFLKPLTEAAEEDAHNMRPWIELSSWCARQSQLHPPGNAIVERALTYARNAQELDPDGKDGYFAEYQLFVLLARRYELEARVFYGKAADAFRHVVEKDPTEASLHYQLAETLFLAGLPVDARREAYAAHSLDEQATTPGRKLTDPQREQIKNWLSRAPAN